jgi:MFS family permease
MMATSRTLGVLLGPALGGALLVLCGPSLGILINVAIYLPLTLWLWKAPYGPRFRQQAAETGTRALRGIDEIRATLREVAGNRTILTMMLLAGGASLLVGNAYQAQMPQFADDLGHGEGGLHYSVLLAATAAGAVIAGLVLESRSLLQAHPRTALILAIAWCFAIAGFAVTDVYPLAVALLFVAGFLDLSYNSMAQTLVQLNAPVAIRGRIIGVYNMVGLGLRAFSGVTVGFGGSLIGIHWSLALSAMVLLVAVATLLSLALRPAPAAGE